MCQKELQDFVDSGHECPSCNEVYDSERGMKIHHKRIHGESIAGAEFDCDWCGDSVRRDPSHIHDDMNNFCSPDCRGEYRSEYHTGEDAARWNGGKVELVCESCGCTYERHPSRVDESRFCSSECRSEGISKDFQGEKGPNYRGGKVVVECETCGTQMEEFPSDANLRRFCTRGCYEQWYSENKNGQDHHLWNGGKSVYDAVKRNLGGRSWDQAREGVLDDRGDYCHMCGCEKKPERNHDIHHIVPIMAGGCNADALLIPLCQTCHTTVERYTESIPEVEPVLVE